MTETVSIPPLVSGVTIYKTWKQSTVDKLKELKLGELFRFRRGFGRVVDERADLAVAAF